MNFEASFRRIQLKKKQRSIRKEKAAKTARLRMERLELAKRPVVVTEKTLEQLNQYVGGLTEEPTMVPRNKHAPRGRIVKSRTGSLVRRYGG